jgi:hypothetical protein
MGLAIAKRRSLKDTKLDILRAEINRYIAQLDAMKRDRAELIEALRWVGEFNYAGGRRFKDVDTIKTLLARLEKEKS